MFIIPTQQPFPPSLIHVYLYIHPEHPLHTLAAAETGFSIFYQELFRFSVVN